MSLSTLDKTIETVAYYKWLDHGCPSGRELEFWLAAEREIDEPAPIVPAPIVNVSRGKAATVSSQYLHFAPKSAVDGDAAEFAFHTDVEERPWWLLDLEAVYAVSRVIVHNRVHCYERASHLIVELGVDPDRLVPVHRQAGVPFGQDGTPLVLEFSPIAARYVKIGIEAENYLHLVQIEVYGAASH